MKLPAKVKVGPFTYKVTSDRHDMNQRCRDESTDLLGHCDRRMGVISVEPQQSLEQKRDTLLHEVLHAITDMTGIEAEMSNELEEQIVRRLSPVLLEVLRKNPKLVAFLVAP